MTYRKALGITIVLATVSIVAAVPVLAKNSHTLSVNRAALLGGTQLQPGSYQVSWEEHSPDLSVTFSSGKKGDALVTAHARLVDRGVKYDRNSILYDENPPGTVTITEIRLAGMNQAIVFDEATSESHTNP